jgi:photosystem II stability/assembly factor-like uncharacterized protein
MKKLLFIFTASFYAYAGFAQWINQTSGVTNQLNDVNFIDNNTGWIVGRQGTMLRTTNGGNSWSAQNSGTTEDLNAIHMINVNLGYAVGDRGRILKYNGTSWSALSTGETRHVYGVHFVNENIGWAVGDWGRLYYTSNGGSSWRNQNDPTNSTKFNAVYALSESEAWAVGTNGRILRYNGNTWGVRTSGVNVELLGVHFLNSNFGFAVGKNSTILFWDGNAWATQNLGLGNNSENIFDVHVLSTTEAYAVVSPGFGGRGVILKYNGSTWSKDYEFSDLGSELFYGLHFPSATRGFAVGGGGLIKSKGTTTPNTGFSQPNQINVISIFPNPSKGRFVINSKDIVISQVEIHNNMGQLLLRTATNKEANTKVDLDGYPKGVYFITITTDERIYKNTLVLE